MASSSASSLSYFLRRNDIVISLNPLAYKNSSKSSGNILTFLILPIGMEVVCDKVTPNNEPLAINVAELKDGDTPVSRQ